MEESISLFIAITGAGPPVARGFLEITGGNFERAIELFYENPDLVGAGITAESPARSRPRPTAGRQDASGVIHISSDDEDDNDMQFDDDLEVSNTNSNSSNNNNNNSNYNNNNNNGRDDDDDERAAAVQAAAIAQEEADAAMAQRLQEEMYRDSGPGGHDVRAPIARTTETLVAPDPSWGMTGGLETGFLEHMRGGRRQPHSRGTGPFAQRIWNEGGSASRATGAAAENGAHARRLEDLFRPPYDLMARLGWDEAREVGKEKKRWIMVNLQDMNDFHCQTLNRDIWKDRAVRELVAENFVFLQYDKDYPDSQEFKTFYFPNDGHENPDNYPHVSIIDPRTGEQVKVWSGRPFPAAREFHAELAEFLDRYSLAANSKNPVAKVAARKAAAAAAVDVDRMTEDEMLEMALRNSLAGPAGGAGGSGVATPSIADPDALTRQRGSGGPATKPEEEEEEEEEEGEEAAGDGGRLNGEGEGEEDDAAAGAFARISSTSPHAEPDNDPATTTRIQFRHPSGRIIRRFGLRDSVRRAYEWLKAEPLEGKAGLAFELKKMPQGEDLIGSLDETIESAGLKQGTVMIEFITEG